MKCKSFSHLTRRLLPAGICALLGSGCMQESVTKSGSGILPDQHPHAQALFENTLLFLDPVHEMIDPVSGYPLEGWNHDPERNLYLRSFTQLTAIGEWMDVLANIAGGYLTTSQLSQEEALQALEKTVDTLLIDQKDPNLSDRGLLVNFLGLEDGKRSSPLVSQVDKASFDKAFGPEKASRIWTALQEKEWIPTQERETDVNVQRGEGYGNEYFDGALEAFADDETRTSIMSILDQRVVQVVFGDNANLSASMAKAIGALMGSENPEDPRLQELMQKMESFLDAQTEGYRAFFNEKTGLCYFGWNATKERTIGWLTPSGIWVDGHSDYLVNEFRAPTQFAVLRFGLPEGAYGNLGFKMKRVETLDGRVLHALAPWAGSAFQPLGLSMFMGELSHPAWTEQLRNVVDIALDYSERHNLPGFLSESYTGNGTEYTGEVGIPELAVTSEPRITDCPSLYTLGTAYRIHPEGVEAMLARHWDLLETLLTPHGPWEGYNVTTGKAIEFQTTAHTLSLLLGFVGTASEHMERYLGSKNLNPESLSPIGNGVDLLKDIKKIQTKGPELQIEHNPKALRVNGLIDRNLDLQFILPDDAKASISGTTLHMRYRSSTAVPIRIEFHSVSKQGTISNEVFSMLPVTGENNETLEIALPPTPGLEDIYQLTLSIAPENETKYLDLTIHSFNATPY